MVGVRCKRSEREKVSGLRESIIRRCQSRRSSPAAADEEAKSDGAELTPSRSGGRVGVGGEVGGSKPRLLIGQQPRVRNGPRSWRPATGTNSIIVTVGALRRL